VDGLAPVGAWVAITGRLPWEAWALGAAVAVWIAGFDLFYSLFDREFDVEQGLHSVAARFGVEGAFRGARLLHVLTVVLLGAVGLGLHLGWFYWLGVAAVAVLLAYEHSLVKPGDLRRLDAAFFTVNGMISVVFFAFVLAEAAL
jgi:4-hydroxybenzoate polyprenyltransferase